MVSKFVAAYIMANFISIEVSYYAVLGRPFHNYWALPVQNPECATYATYYEILIALNISSDTLIMGLAGSVSYQSQLSLKRKIIVAGIFCMGFFTIAAGILNK
jgi:hypothetical protein